MPDNPTGRRVGRPSRPVLNRDLIAGAALEIITERGQPALTMKALATRLGVTVAALYNHIASKSELLLVVQDELMSRVDVDGFRRLSGEEGHRSSGESLWSALDTWARSYRQVFAEYPDLVPLIATMPVSGSPATRCMYETVTAGMTAVGVPQEEIMPVIISFENFLYGSAMDVHAPASIFELTAGETDAPSLQTAVKAFTSACAEKDSSSKPVADADNPYAEVPFERGLTALLRDAVERLTSQDGTGQRTGTDGSGICGAGER